MIEVAATVHFVANGKIARLLACWRLGRFVRKHASVQRPAPKSAGPS